MYKSLASTDDEKRPLRNPTGDDMSRLGANAKLSEQIDTLEKKNRQLERMLARLGTQADTRSFQNQLHKQRSDTKALCQEIIVKIKK